MTWPALPHPRARLAASLLLLAVAGAALGCGDPLEVDDPTAVLENDLNNAEGAQLLRRSALRTLYEAAGDAAFASGLIADEFLFQQEAFWDQLGVVTPNEQLDRRASEQYQQVDNTPGYGAWQQLWARATPAALAKLLAYALPGAREAHAGEMYAVRGYAALRLGEDFCPGFPLHEVVDYKVRYGPPLSTEQVLQRALAAFDSALTLAADSARILDFARVGRARTLLNLGRVAEAAVAVTDVPTGYAYETEYSATLQPTNPLARTQPSWGVTWSVADQEGGTGLDFVAAQDPRVPTDSVGPSENGAIGLYALAKYSSDVTPIRLASGIEARLIEAEAALRTDPENPRWLSILNELRRTQVTPALPDTTDPGTAAGRVNLLFRERAFWLFGTGSRLGDLRRLIRQYSRTSESVFPTGAYYRGGVYSTATSLPFHLDEVRYSPGVTGCTSW